jgi:hypothetical protein
MYGSIRRVSASSCDLGSMRLIVRRRGGQQLQYFTRPVGRYIGGQRALQAFDRSVGESLGTCKREEDAIV